MRVAVIHYHLRRGGVTRVVESAQEALQLADCPVDLLCIAGETYGGAADLSVAVLPDLAYQQEARAGVSLWESLQEICLAHWGALPDVWHIHNHSLGKNVYIPALLADLVAAGQRLLLQTHDFAEEGRPANYQVVQRALAEGGVLYPVGEGIAYATLNGRDAQKLVQSGVPSAQVGVLPNPVAMPEGLAELERQRLWDADCLTLYPVRGIRRKNVGEFLWWSLAAEAGEKFALSLVPENPQELVPFEAWRQFAAEQDLPVVMGSAQQTDCSFAQVVVSAQRIVTTSIAEGFGLAFLEPWSFDRPLCGRRIPGIVDDFVQEGLAIEHMYERLCIPLQLVDEALLRRQWQGAVQQYLQAYGHSAEAVDWQAAWADWTVGDSLDFGRLSEEMQRSVLLQLQADEGLRTHCQPGALAMPGAEAVAANKAVVAQQYGMEAYGRKLYAQYCQLAESAAPEVGEEVAPSAVLGAFLAIEEFAFLRA